MPYLTIIGSDGRTFRRDIDSDILKIGRSSKNDVNLSFDLSLSRFHAEVSRKGGKYYLRDVGSRNGTNLNGKPVLEAGELSVGDKITLGETTILFAVDKDQIVTIEDTLPSSGDISTVSIPLEDIISSPVVAAPRRKAPGVEAPENRTLAVMTRAGMELINQNPLDEVLEIIMNLVFEATPAERGFMMLTEGENKELVSKVIRDPKGSYAGKISLSRTIAKGVVENKQAILTSDAQSDERFKMKESIVLQGIHSAMCVPLWNNKEVIGLIYVDRLQAMTPFNEEDLKLLSLLANMAAVKIENARLFEETLAKHRMEKEMQGAAEIQRKLLPVDKPRFQGYEVTGFNNPCREVGGDYYDFIQRSPELLGFAIGDVSGKGMGAALLMATVRASFRAHVQAWNGFQTLICALNETILQSANSNNFISFVYAEIEGRTGHMTYINAGHNPPLLVRTTGEIERLEPDGLILGVFPGARYRQSEATLEPGDLLVAFSDGVTETVNEDGEEFGEDRLVGLLRENLRSPAVDLEKLVTDSIRVFAGKQPQHDDVTLIVIKRTA